MKRFDRNDALWLAAPLVLAATLLVLGPMLATLVLAFTDYDALSAPRFNGWANLQRLWDDPVFWKSVQNSTLIAAFGHTTSHAVIEAGLRLDIQAPVPEAPSMTMSIENYLKKNNK